MSIDALRSVEDLLGLPNPHLSWWTYDEGRPRYRKGSYITAYGDYKLQVYPIDPERTPIWGWEASNMAKNDLLLAIGYADSHWDARKSARNWLVGHL